MSRPFMDEPSFPCPTLLFQEEVVIVGTNGDHSRFERVPAALVPE